MTGRRLVALLALAVVLVAGLWRLRIDVDVFNLLPADSPMVEGLKQYQQSFGSSQELIVSLRSPTARSAEQAARSLAAEIEASGLASRVISQSPFGNDAELLAELVAYLWFNQPADDFESMTARFEQPRLAPTLESSLDRLATSLSPQQVARLSHDPYAVTDLLDRLPQALPQGSDDPFASADGRFRILFVGCPQERPGFWGYRRWVEEMRQLVEGWRLEASGDEDLELRITGDPAFISEVGSGLLEDMELAAAGTLLLVGCLFWLSHRRWRPLLWLVVLLIAVLALTVALGGLLMGSLNAVSLGFAAILLGLAADYGLILYQEFRVFPERSLAEHRAEVAPSILWAAATTAGAFFMISRSSLPGLTQLGILVGVGILVAAAVMLLAFLPPLAASAKERRQASDDASRIPAALGLGARSGWWITVLALVVSVAVLAMRLPAIDAGTDDLGPKESGAQAAIEEIQREIGGFGDALWLMVAGADEGEVAAALERARSVLDRATAEGVLSEFMLPDVLWPRPERQRANREAAGRVADRLPAAREAALAAGFTADSLRLTDGIFESWRRFADSERVVWPSHPGSEWLIRQFAAADQGRMLALGRLDASEQATQSELVALAARIESEGAGRLLGWELLSESLLGAITRDLGRVLLPMAVLLILMLGLAFRSLSEIVLSLATLLFSLLCLSAVMSVAGWSWNLMNVMALPLLFGAGVDYSIHVQLALQRHRGDVLQMRRTVGRAILLCGASTAAGFGTLGLASNAGMASLGRVCATGVVIAALVAVLLLPAWWRSLAWRGPRAEKRP